MHNKIERAHLVGNVTGGSSGFIIIESLFDREISNSVYIGIISTIQIESR